jgi:hypothetical protein
VTHNKASVRFSTNMASEELRSVQAGQEAGAHPTDFSTLFPCPFYHNTTLQHYRLLSVTTTVTKFTFTGPGKACSRIFSLGAKPCMLVSLELDADFSRGVHPQQCNRPFLRPTRNTKLPEPWQ